MKKLEKVSAFAGTYFAPLVIFVSILALIEPRAFTWITGWIVPLLGVIMFGMGLTLKASDFKVVLTRPKPVLLGVLAQFTIMPLVAYGLAVIFQLPPSLAAGVVLVGACPGGTASNVMVYLAKGDVPLSVAMTSVSTLLSPIVTPLLLWLLAGRWLPVDFFSLLISIVQVVIVPILLGIAVRKRFPQTVEKSIRALPLVSVTGIVAIVAGVVAVSKEQILSSGILLFTVVALHNLTGLLLGYATAYVLRLDEEKRRAISIEVGMQNSGLGVSLATVHFNPLAALPSAIFSVWHNISGPILASFWSKKPADIYRSKSPSNTLHPKQTKEAK